MYVIKHTVSGQYFIEFNGQMGWGSRQHAKLFASEGAALFRVEIPCEGLVDSLFARATQLAEVVR